MDEVTLNALVRGLRFTVGLMLTGSLLGLIAAFIAGLTSLSSVRALRFLAVAYIEFFRGSSLLVQLFWIFFVLPLLGLDLSPFMAGTLALGLNIGAYGAEVVRGAIRATPITQIEAAIALNLPRRARLQKVIIPQALVTMLPPFGNLAIELLKATSLVSLITVPELTYQAQLIRSQTGQTVLVFSLLLFIYFALSGATTLSFRWLERRTTGKWLVSG